MGEAVIGWIGTGVMGASMAGRLMDAGHALRIHTRTKSAARALLDRGATWAETPAAAADGTTITFSIVGYPSDVEMVHLGETGTLAATTPPGIIVDMTTSRPALAERLAERASSHGVASIDAPVSGGDIGARQGTLSIMVGGSTAAYGRARPYLELMGERIVHQGGPGAGQHTKMVNQILIASTMMGACEGLLYAERAGLDGASVIESVGSGAAGSWTIANLGPRMLAEDFAPGFSVEHFVKDLRIALEEADRLGLALPGLALARQFYHAAMATGHGRNGTQVLLRVLRRLNGLDNR